MDMGLGLRRRRHVSPPRRNGVPHRDDTASDDPPSPAPPSARSHLNSVVARIRRYAGRAPPTGPSFETALSAVGHPSLQRAGHPVHAPDVPTPSALDSTALDSVALPTSPATSASDSSSYAADNLGHPADHTARALPRLHTSDYDIHGPAAPFAPALYSVGPVISPAPSAGDSRPDVADYISADSSVHALNEARFTRDNVLYAYSFLCLGAILQTRKDIEDGWYTGFETFFILMMMVSFGMIGGRCHGKHFDPYVRYQRYDLSRDVSYIIYLELLSLIDHFILLGWRTWIRLWYHRCPLYHDCHGICLEVPRPYNRHHCVYFLQLLLE